jgi:hypothetical protein
MHLSIVTRVCPDSPLYKLDAHSNDLQDISEIDVGSLSLSSHTSIGRLDWVGRTILLVSDLVFPPHLGDQRCSNEMNML